MKTSIKRIRLHATRMRVADPLADFYGKAVLSSRDIDRIAAGLLAGEDQEVCLVFMLDAKNQVIAYAEVARGSLTDCCVTPREVFRIAIMQGAASIVFAHNHPSGDPAPSAEDHTATQRLVSAGELLGIAVLDHVIIAQATHAPGVTADPRYFSFCDAGLLTAMQKLSFPDYLERN